ncbi:histidinol-phosphate transaminase, partial [Bacillus sp. S34]|nr:histidinol-phosphate transaminase [Bacillus sp. S34]
TDGIVMVDEAYAEFMPADVPSALTLLPAKRRALTADTPEMVDARLRFLGHGHYAPVERADTRIPVREQVVTGAQGTG